MTIDPSDLSRLAEFARGVSAPRQTAHEFVRSVLRRAILSGELSGGTRLVQADLASVLEVSTTPVREALRELASEGLVRFDPHRGAVVQELSGEELAEIYAIREVLEPLALRRAVPRLTADDLAHLRRLHEKMAGEPGSEEWVDANRAFHTAVLEAADSPRLAAIIRSLEDASVMYIGASLNEVPGLREDAVADHGEFLEALERGDVAAAVKVAVRHLGLALRAFESRNAGD